MRQLGSSTLLLLFTSLFLLPGSGVRAGDWPMFGRDQTRNPFSPETGAAMFWQIEKRDDRGGVTQAARNIKWTARLGAITYGDPVIANGLVWVGTNNGQPGDGHFQKDASVLMCFRESDGRLVYRYHSPRLENNPSCDWPFASLACSPLIENDRLWFTTNRCETVCLDIGPLLRNEDEARVVWKVDMMKELGVHPLGSLMSISHFCSPAGYRDYIYVITGNGVEDAVRVPAPAAPSLVCFSKKTGKVVWTDNSPGKNILEGQWASPLVIEIGGRSQVIAPLGDGWLRSFDALSGKLLWEFDMNPKEAKWSLVRSIRTGILATPVFYDGRIYISSGRHPAEGNDSGRLCCLDPTKRGDISSEQAVDAGGKLLPRRRIQAVDRAKGEKAVRNPNSGLIWDFVQRGEGDTNTMHGSVGNAAVHAGLVIAADNQGYVHCLDARTGKKHWTCDTSEEIVSSPLIVDGKVYVTLSGGQVAIFRLSADPLTAMRKTGHHFESIASMEMPWATWISPVFANGVLYVAAGRELFAIQNESARAGEGTHGYWPQWRGPDRSNVSQEKGLLQQWPVEGPPLLWRAAPLGQGIAPVSVAGGRIFTSGYENGNEFAIALDEQTGQRVWATFLSSSIPQAGIHRLMRWLSQRAATVDGDRLYYVTSAGDLICLSSADGKELWRRSYPRDFNAHMPTWSFCDIPLVDGDRLICMPGGAEAALVALNKKTGGVIWKSSGLRDARAGYSLAMAADIGGIRQYVALVGGGLAGFAAKDGKILWHYDRIASPWNSHAPIIRGDQIFCTNGYGGGMALVKLVRQREGLVVEEQYYRKELISSIQDSSVPLALGDYAYDFARHGLVCIEIKTGKIVWQARPRADPRQQRAGFVRGSLTYADGCLYVRDSSGGVALVAATPKDYVEKSTFKVPGHQESLGATAPVIAGGRLYLRDEDVLYCYDIRTGSAARPRQEARNVTLPPLTAPGQGATLSDGAQAGKQRGPDALFVPTPQEVVEKMLELAGTKKKDLVYDLGSGDGRIVIAAAKKYGCKAVGYEIDPELVKLSRQEIQKSQLQNLVRIEPVDFFTIDLNGADVIAVYLPPRVLARLLPQLAKMKPGARIVSHYFEIPGCKPEQVATVH